MNIQEYKKLVFNFFSIIFNQDYIKVSIPFVISISIFWIFILRFYYKTKIKFIQDKFSHEYLILHTELVQRRGEITQIPTSELYPTLSTYYNINPNQIITNEQLPRASAPPQYIVTQGDFSQI